MNRRCRALRCDEDRSEDGSISLYFAIVTVAALMMAGLVVDGGAALATRERAADLATQAARAGATALTPASLRGLTGGLQADPAAATRAADAILADAGATGRVVVAGATVTVTVRVPRHTVILSAVGLDDISQSASATATAVAGTATTPDGG
jgi:Flp pilus assembly protein TadG